MQSSIEKTEGLAYKLTVELPAETLDQATLDRLKEVRGKVRIDGFRRGKVPPAVVKQRYGASIRQEVIGDLVEKSYREALEKENRNPVAPPQINLLSGAKEGEPLKYEATFEEMPEVEVKGLEALEIVLPVSEVGEKDIEEMVQTLRRQQATFTENNEKKVEENDRIRVDFFGKLDGEAFEGGSGEDVSVLIGSGQMLPDFENGLKGAEVGKEMEFKVHFPEDYPEERLKGKDTVFTATVKKIEEMHLPEVDEEFIKRFGLESNDHASFVKAIRENMERELKNALRRIRRSRLFDALIKHNGDLEVPHALLDREMHQMGEEMQLSKQVPDHHQRHELLHRLFEPQAKRRLQLGLLLGKLFDKHDLKLDQARVDERLDSIAASYEDPKEVKAWYQKDEKSRASLESAILEEQLIDALYETAKVEEEAKTFQEIMAINSQIRD